MADDDNMYKYFIKFLPRRTAFCECIMSAFEVRVFLQRKYRKVDERREEEREKSISIRSQLALYSLLIAFVQTIKCMCGLFYYGPVVLYVLPTPLVLAVVAVQRILQHPEFCMSKVD